MDADRIVDGVLSALEACDSMKYSGWIRGPWTRGVSTELCRAGKELDLSVWASRVDQKHKDGGEWLFDVTWLEYGSELNSIPGLQSIPMAAECEWGDWGAITDDFQKLLVSRADVRVMVCPGWTVVDDHDGRATAERMCKWISAFERTGIGDRYILALYERRDALWCSQRYFVVARGPGEPPTLERLGARR